MPVCIERNVNIDYRLYALYLLLAYKCPRELELRALHISRDIVWG